MKATRILLAALALALVTGCTATNITGPDASAEESAIQRGFLGSGQG